MSSQKRAFKTELELNNVQRSACARHAGAARFAYNWGLAEKQAARERGEKAPSAIDLHRKLNQLKMSELVWMYEVSKCAPQEALRDLDNVVLTPHVGSATDATRQAMADLAHANLVAHFAGKALPSAVPECKSMAGAR